VRRAIVALLLVVVAALVAAQLILPGVSEQRLRDRLGRNGRVTRVEVHSFPAIKLLWSRADRVVVRMSSASAGTGKVADLLASAGDTGELDARVAELKVTLLRLGDVRLRKRGDRLDGRATVTTADLSSSLPPGFTLRPVAAGGGALVFEGTATFLGRTLRARAVAAARDGKLLVAPDVPFGGLVALTVFADPRVTVEDVGAQVAADGFTLTARGRLTK
jgi:hypothetical protein